MKYQYTLGKNRNTPLLQDSGGSYAELAATTLVRNSVAPPCSGEICAVLFYFFNVFLKVVTQVSQRAAAALTHT